MSRSIIYIFVDARMREYRESIDFGIRICIPWRDFAPKFARADMQVDQVEDFGASRKDGGQDEVSRVVCCLLFLVQCWVRKRERERGRERETAFLP